MSQSKYMNLDAAESAFFDRQLDLVKSGIYGVEYPQFKSRQFIPVNNEGDGGVTTIRYRMRNKHGVAKVIADRGRDLPRATVSGQEFAQLVRPLGIEAAWTVQEIAAAARGGYALPTEELTAARFGMEYSLDQIGQFGDSDSGLKGFLNHSSVTPSDVAAGAATTRNWETKTANEILLDIQEMIETMAADTLGVQEPNTLALPVSSYGFISMMPRSTTSDMTVLNFLLTTLRATMPNFTIMPWYALETAGDSSSKRMVLYKRDPSVLTLEIPMELQFLAPQAVGLEVIVAGWMTTGGVLLYQPKAVIFRDKI